VSIVIPRSTWQPRHANGCAVIGTSEWVNAGKELWLHHSITNPPGPDATLAQDCAHVRDFEAIGQNRFGCGISYTWVVMPSGRVFQGHDLDRQGTHTYGRNNRSRAICLAGNFDVNPLPQRMQNSVALLLRELGATLDGGHRDVFATACPGQHAYPLIGAMNSLALSGVPVDEEESKPMIMLARGSGGGDAIYWIAPTSRGLVKEHVTTGDLASFFAMQGAHAVTLDQAILDGITLAGTDPIADVDEEALAEALEARGIDGANPAEVKAALTDVLARTGLTVSPPPTGV
jgi:hypothetical protein